MTSVSFGQMLKVSVNFLGIVEWHRDKYHKVSEGQCVARASSVDRKTGHFIVISLESLQDVLVYTFV